MWSALHKALNEINFGFLIKMPNTGLLSLLVLSVVNGQKKILLEEHSGLSELNPCLCPSGPVSTCSSHSGEKIRK